MTVLNQQVFDNITSSNDASKEQNKGVETPSIRMFEDIAGNKFYHDENGKYHREDGPAVECVHGHHTWYVHGRVVSKSEHSKLYPKDWWKGADAIMNDAFKFVPSEAIEKLLARQVEEDKKYLNEFITYLNEKLEDGFVKNTGIVIPVPSKFYTTSFTRSLHLLLERFQRAGFVVNHSLVLDDGIATPCFVFSSI